MTAKSDLRFLRNVNLSAPSDFNQEVKDKMNREIGNMYNNRQIKVGIDDFLYLFKLESLIEEAYKNFIENSFDINFISLSFNSNLHSDRTSITLSIKNRDNFKFPDYWFIAFSDVFELIKETKTDLTVKQNNKEFTFNIQTLKNAKITYQIL
jgi:hypothetical protein